GDDLRGWLRESHSVGRAAARVRSADDSGRRQDGAQRPHDHVELRRGAHQDRHRGAQARAEARTQRQASAVRRRARYRVSVDIPCAKVEGPEEDPDFLSRQLVTYIGNKRALLGTIAIALDRIRLRLGKTKLRALDAFAGSGVVSRFLKAHCAYL